MCCPLPTAADVPRFRLLFVAMEAAFSFYFWAMKSATKDYGMGICCPWSRDTFTYGGFGSHNALMERVAGNFDLSKEQLEALAAETKEKTRLNDRNYYAERRATDPEGLKAQKAAAATRHYYDPNGKGKAARKRWTDEAESSKKYYCSVCNFTCSGPAHLARHNITPQHLRYVQRAEAGVVDKYHCDLCCFSTSRLDQMKRHKDGPRHKKRAAKAGLSPGST